MNDALPLLPLVMADVAPALVAALATEGISVVSHAIGPTAGRFVLHDSKRRQAPDLAAGQIGIDVGRHLSTDGLDVRQLHDERTAPHLLTVGEVAVREEVSLCDKRVLRQQVLAQLRAALEAEGGCWLRISAYPHPYRTAFCLRLDHDEYVPDDFDRCMAALAGHESATTHFVCAAPHAKRPEALTRLRGLDVGGHGYWHHSYRELAALRANIERGLAVLADHGLQPRGYAAPHGRYSAELGQALSELGLEYSSEFGFLYDDLPLRPDGSTLWQIPVHPVCLGIVLEAAQRAGCDSASAALWLSEHFARVAAAKHASGEPLFFYGHPDGRLGRYPEVITRLFAAVSVLPGVWWTNFSTFAAWWGRRALVSWQVVEGDVPGTVQVRAKTDLTHDRALTIEHVDANGIARFSWDGQPRTFDLRGAPREPHGPGAPRLFPDLQSPGWNERLKRWLDYERVTPRTEFDRRNWRGRIKYTIRLFKEGPQPHAVHR